MASNRRQGPVSPEHVANLVAEIWDSEAACAERPWRATHLVLHWWRTALLEEAHRSTADLAGGTDA